MPFIKENSNQMPKYKHSNEDNPANSLPLYALLHHLAQGKNYTCLPFSFLCPMFNFSQLATREADGPRENFVLYMYCIHEIYHINLKFIILANNRVYTKCYLYEQMIDLLYLVELGIHKLSYYVLLN